MQARHLVWPMFGTITTSTLAVLLTWWLVSINRYNTLTLNVLAIMLLMWAACLSPAVTKFLGRRWSRNAGIVIMVIMWCGWMFFFNELAYFGPAAAFSSWWLLARDSTSEKLRPRN